MVHLLQLLFLGVIIACTFSYDHDDFIWCQYEIHQVSLKWCDAQEVCKLRNKTLASIGNLEDHSFLGALLRSSVSLLAEEGSLDRMFWIGLHQDHLGNRKWADGKNYVIYDDYNPAGNHHATGTNCFMFDSWESSMFQSTNCVLERMFICKAKTLDTETCFKTTYYAPSDMGLEVAYMAAAEAKCRKDCFGRCVMYKYYESGCYYFTRHSGKGQRSNSYVVKELLQTRIDVIYGLNAASYGDCFASIESSHSSSSITPIYEKSVDPTTSKMYMTPSISRSVDKEYKDLNLEVTHNVMAMGIPTPALQTFNNFVVISPDVPLPFLTYTTSHPKIPLNSSLQINVVCNNCQTPTYVLIMQKDGSDEQETLKQDNSVLTIPNNIMHPGENWNFNISANPWAYGKLSANITMYVNELPYNGVCDISPTSGIASTTIFRLDCNNWKDEGDKCHKNPQTDTDADLSLELYKCRQSGEISQQLLGPVPVTAKPDFTLLGSYDDDDYTTNLAVRVKDKIGDFVSFSFTINVYLTLLHSKTAEYLNWAIMNNDTMTVLEKGKQLVSEWNNVTLSNPSTGDIVNVLPKEWTGGVLDVDENCNNSFTYNQLLEDVLGLKDDKHLNFVSKEIEKISAVMTKNVRDNGIDLYDVVAAVDAFMVVVNDSIRITETSMKYVAEAHVILSNMLISFVNDGSNKDMEIFSSITRLASTVVNAIIPRDLPNWFAALMTEDSKTAREYVDFMAFVYGNKAYKLIECSLITPEERTSIYKFHSKHIRQQFEQKQLLAKQFLGDVLRAQDDVFFKLFNILCYGCNHTIDSDALSAVTMKGSSDSLSGFSVNMSGLSCTATMDKNANVILMSVIVFKRNPWIMGTSTTSSLVSSGIVKMKCVDGIENDIHIRSISTIFPVMAEASSVLHPTFVAGDTSRCIYHSLMNRHVGDNICVKIDVLYSTDVTTYEVYARHGKFPTHITFDASSKLSRKNNWTSCLIPVFDFGIVNICLRPILSTARNNNLDRTQKLQRQQTFIGNALTPYNLTIMTASCQVWDKEKEIWKSENDKCSMSWLTSQDKLRCICRDINKELIVGHSFYVPANTISFSTVFLRFSLHDQASVLGVLITIVILYMVLCIWARKEDEKDLLKWGVTPLIDNFVDETYFYLITVYTGMRFGAGTDTKVQFEVVGTRRETGVRTLYDGVREEFCRGSVMHFVMTTGHPLGDLDYIHIWLNPHDDKPVNPWYLNRIDVEDLQQKRRYVFGCNKWLPDESKSRCLEVVLPVYGKEDALSFRNLFYLNVFENLTESHIFASIFHRPTSSTFTRVQRVTCLFVFVVMAMISNAIYFVPNDQYEDPEQLKFGPMILSSRIVYVSLISSAISSGSTLLISLLFRKSKMGYDKNGTKNRHRSSCSSVYHVFERFFKESRELEKTLIAQGMVYTDGIVLPYWCTYVAWFLSIGGSMASLFFLMLFSMEWEKQKSDIWLTQFFLSFGENCIVLDQLKVPIIAVIFAVVFVRVRSYRPSLLTRLQVLESYKQRFVTHRDRGNRRTGPRINSHSLRNAMLELNNGRVFVMAVRKAIFSCMFILIVSIISYGNRDSRSFRIQKNIKNNLINPSALSEVNFDKIKTVNEYVTWLHDVALTAIFPEESYYKETLHWRWREYFGDFHNFRVGPPRLRQLRVAAENSSYPMLGRIQTYGSYDIGGEVTEDYCKAWRSLPCNLKDQTYSFSRNAWTYTSAVDVWGIPIAGLYDLYGGSGYIAELDVNRNISQIILSELVNNKWIDRSTRAVFLEFTLYSPNVNLFTHVAFLTERPETGGIITSYTLYPFRIYQHYGKYGVAMTVCEVLFVIASIILLILIVLDISKQGKVKYLSSVFNSLDLVTFATCLIVIGLYIARFLMAVETMNKFKRQPKSYLNFQHLVALDSSFVVALSIVQALVTIRCIGNLKFFRSVETLFHVLAGCKKDLIWFSVMFWYVLLGFASLGTCLFGNSFKSHISIIKSLETLIITSLGKTNFKHIQRTDPILANVYFFLFIAIQVYFLLTMFMAVLSECIDAAGRKKFRTNPKLADIFQEICRRIFKQKSLDITMRPAEETPILMLKEICTECHKEWEKIQNCSKRIHKTKRRSKRYQENVV